MCVSDFNCTCFHTYIIMCFKVIKVLCVCCMRESVGCLWMHTCRSVASRCVCVAQRRRGAAGEGVADAAFVAVPAAPPPSKGALLRRSVASAFQNVLVPPEKKVSLRSMAGPPGGQLLPKDTQFTILNISTGMRQNIILLLVSFTQREKYNIRWHNEQRTTQRKIFPKAQCISCFEQTSFNSTGQIHFLRLISDVR